MLFLLTSITVARIIIFTFCINLQYNTILYSLVQLFKGYSFIEPSNKSKDVFLHISLPYFPTGNSNGFIYHVKTIIHEIRTSKKLSTQ